MKAAEFTKFFISYFMFHFPYLESDQSEYLKNKRTLNHILAYTIMGILTL